MAKDPDNRYATTVDLANAAQRALTTPDQVQAAVADKDLPPHPRPEVRIDPTNEARTEAGPTMSASDAPTKQARVAPLSELDASPPDERTPFQRLSQGTKVRLVAFASLVVVAVVVIVVIMVGSRSSSNGGIASQVSTTTSSITTSTPTTITSTTHADAADDNFLAMLKSEGITDHVSPSHAIQAAHTVCQKLDDGETPAQVANDVLNNSAMPAYHCGYFVGAAIKVFCPQYTPAETPTG